MTDRLARLGRVVDLIRDRERGRLAQINADQRALEAAQEALARDPGLDRPDAPPVVAALWYRGLDRRRAELGRQAMALEAARTEAIADLAKAEGRAAAIGDLRARAAKERARQAERRAEAENTRPRARAQGISASVDD